MTDFKQTGSDAYCLIVDTSIYDDSVIDKVLYWMTKDYVITRSNIVESSLQTICLTLKTGHKRVEFDALKAKLSDDFIDYKNRQIVAKETSNIRDLLFAKAFAHRDDFVEFTFKD